MPRKKDYKTTRNSKTQEFAKPDRNERNYRKQIQIKNKQTIDLMFPYKYQELMNDWEKKFLFDLGKCPYLWTVKQRQLLQKFRTKYNIKNKYWEYSCRIPITIQSPPPASLGGGGKTI